MRTVELVLVLVAGRPVAGRRREDFAAEEGWSPQCWTVEFQAVVEDRRM